MKRKPLFSLFLALTMAVGLFAVPARALDEDGFPTYEEFKSQYSVISSIEEGLEDPDLFYVEEPGTLYRADLLGEADDYHVNDSVYWECCWPSESYGYNLIRKGDTITVANTAQGIDCTIDLKLRRYVGEVYDTDGQRIKLPNNDYLYLDEYALFLLEDGSWGLPTTSEPVSLHPGESVTFDFQNIVPRESSRERPAPSSLDDDVIYEVSLSMKYAGKHTGFGDGNFGYSVDFDFYIDDDEANTIAAAHGITLPAVPGGQPSGAEEQPSHREPSAWAQSEIEAATMAGLVPQLTDEPGYQDPITREQFAELVFCATVHMTTGELRIPLETFSDTDNPQVRKAAGLGIVNGVGEGRFDPKATTNREQIATMLYRAWGLVGTPAASQGLNAYSDSASVSSWAAEAVGTMAVSGIMKGTSDTTLSPADPCTVEQAILLVYRLYQQCNG